MPGRRKKSRRKQPVELSNNDVDVDDDDPDRVWCSCGRPFGTDGFMILHSFSEQSALEPFALKAAMLMPNLLLQKPHN